MHLKVIFKGKDVLEIQIWEMKFSCIHFSNKVLEDTSSFWTINEEYKNSV